MNRVRIVLAAIVCVAVSAWFWLPARDSVAQSGSRRSSSQGSGGSGSTTRQALFETRFWQYLTTSHYRNWAPVPGESGDFYQGESPHGSQLKMYLNRVAAGNVANLPNGSVLIKENYDDNRKLMAITVMYRTKGFNPSGGDWWWAKYNPDGTVARAPQAAGGLPLRGAPKGCLQCHGSAAGNDFVFLND